MINKIIAASLLLIVLMLCSVIYFESVKIHHLNKENAKFKHEIEYLKGSNDLLQEDNREFQDALWHYHDMKMKEVE